MCAYNPPQTITVQTACTCHHAPTKMIGSTFLTLKYNGNNDVIISKDLVEIDSKVYINIPKNYYASIQPIQSLASQGLMFYNTIYEHNHDHVGRSIKIICSNVHKPITLVKGDFYAHIVLHPYYTLSKDK